VVCASPLQDEDSDECLDLIRLLSAVYVGRQFSPGERGQARSIFSSSDVRERKEKLREDVDARRQDAEGVDTGGELVCETYPD